MTAPTTPPRRGRPPTPGGAATGAERSARSRARRQVVTVELDLATVELVNEVMKHFSFDSRVDVVRLAIQTAHEKWLTQLARKPP